jgi:putative ABC transport system permease protein
VITDFVISSGSFVGTGLSPKLVTDLQALPETQTAAGLRLNLAEVGGSAQLVMGFDPHALPEIFSFNVTAGSLDDMGTDGVMITRKKADDMAVTVGSPLPMKFQETGRQILRVAAIYDSNLGAALPGGGGFLIGQQAYDANYPVNQQTENQIYVKLKPGADPAAARAAIEAATAAYPTAKVQDLAQFKSAQVGQINQFLNVIYALLGLSLIIALIGIINTLLLSVYERVREIGLLRAVGETRRQLRSTVRWEAVIITVLGTLLGVVIGLVFGWALVRALADQGIKVFEIPWGQLLLFVVIGGGFGVLAAVYPAFRASRLNILNAIASD